MTSRFSFILLLLASLPSAFSDDKPPAPKQTLNGLWRADVSDSQALLLRIKGDEIELKIEVGGKVSPIWMGKLVLSKEQPDKHLDWTNLKAGEREFPDNRCLYEHQGNVLLIIGGGPTERPKRFYSGPGPEPKTLVFVRAEP